jgi:hypothetical protein
MNPDRPRAPSAACVRAAFSFVMRFALLLLSL